MSNSLEKLLREIEPLPDLASAEVSRALNSFPLDRAVVSDYDTFCECLTRFHCHAESCLLRCRRKRAVSYEHDLSQCDGFLRPVLGKKHALAAAFELANTGKKGGMLGVLRALGEAMADWYAGNWISAKVSCYLKSQPHEAKLKDMDAYLEKYGRLYPGELTERGGIRLRFEFEDVLRIHPVVVRNVQQSVRRT